MGNQVIFSIKEEAIEHFSQMTNQEFFQLIQSRFNHNYTHYEDGLFVSHAHHSSSSKIHIIGSEGGFDIQGLFVDIDALSSNPRVVVSNEDNLKALKPIVRKAMHASIVMCGEEQELSSNSKDSFFVFGFLTDRCFDIEESSIWKDSIISVCKGERQNTVAGYATTYIGKFSNDQYAPVYQYSSGFASLLPFNCERTLIEADELKRAKNKNTSMTSFQAMREMFLFYGFSMTFKV
jgi:hypothetical protein